MPGASVHSEKCKLPERLFFAKSGTIMCAMHSGLWLQAEARRGQSGPRKPDKAPVSMARSRCKTGRPLEARESE